MHAWVSVMHDYRSAILYRFVLGVEDIEEEQRYKIKEEDELYDDIIYLNNVKNSYFSLTNRTIKILQYIIERQYTFSYIMKCDDDSFLDVRRITTELQNRGRPERFYWGEMVMGGVLTKGIYKETHWTSCSTYSPYAFGGGYVLSGDLVQLVVENEPYLKRYNSEDVSLGAWISAYNIERKHDSRFNTGSSSKGCKPVYLTIHKVSRENMYSHYTSLLHDGSICGPTNSWHNHRGYIFNWTAFPPSKKCCIPSFSVP